MPALTVASIVTRVARSLNDEAHATWTVADLLEYLSEAQRAIVLLVPNANPVTRVIQLQAGTRQSIPDDAYSLIEVVRNMGTDGATPGRTITPAERTDLDRTDPMWHRAAASNEVENSVYDLRDRRNFYVSPPQPAADMGRIEVVIAAIPPEITAESGVIALDDIYEPAITAYMLARARIKDVSEEGQGPRLSQLFHEQFLTVLLGREEAPRAQTLVRVEAGEDGIRG